jgi:hypothetical protein
MSKHGMPRTKAEERKLAAFAGSEMTHAQIGVEMGRSAGAVYNKIQELRNRAAGRASPYAVRRDSPLQVQR